MAKIYYIIGSSGAGKDSIMNYAKEKLGQEMPVLFAHRYITRPASDPTENHIFLSEEEFAKRIKGQVFAMHWFSHGYYYGIGVEINAWLDQGFNVIINGSREYWPIAISLFPAMQTLMIEVKPDILRERLIKRGRESLEDIEKRMARNQKIGSDQIPCTRIWNNSSLEESGDEFIRIISQL